jgi:DNA-binding LacI/PurR family transcriptional regulator
MAKVTIREVAMMAGVGIGTVSRVLNNNPHVSDLTRRKVMEAIDELGFKPNAVARQLPRKSNFQTIAIMTLPFREYYSFAERLYGVQEALFPYQDDFELTIYNTDTLQDYDERLTTIIDRSVMAGMLIIDLDLTLEQKQTLRNMGIPFVGLNHYQADDWHCIGTNNVQGGYLAGKHLADFGHKIIGYVGNDFTDSVGFKTSGERFAGLTQALAEHNLVIQPEHVKQGELHFEVAKAHTHELLELDNCPTAIFAMCDTQALGCIAAIREKGLRVPEDISVIGYDDLEVSNHIGLTTVRQHLKLSGKMSMEYLLHLVQYKTHLPKPTLPPLEVLIRNTTQRKL